MGMAIVIALIVLVWLRPPYYLRSVFRSEPLQPVFHLHGFVFSSVGGVLRRSDRVWCSPAHPRASPAGLGRWRVGVVMLVVGYMAALPRRGVGSARRRAPPPLVFLVIPFTTLWCLPSFATALYFRRQSRFTSAYAAATISILTAAIARLPYVPASCPLAFFG